MTVAHRVVPVGLLIAGAVLATTACATVTRPLGRPGQTTAQPGPATASPESNTAANAATQPPAPEIAAAITCAQTAESRVTCRDSTVVAGANPVAAFRPLDSASMSDDELRVFGPDTAAWIAFVRQTAGAAAGAERVYVDGMPALTSVPASMIGRVTVNGDPFTSEFAGAGETRIDLDLRTPDRRWRIDLSSPSFGAGGGSLIGPAGAPVARSSALSVSGAVPRVPVTFFVQATERRDARQPLFVTPHAATLSTAGGDVQTASTSSALMANVAFVTGRVILRGTVAASSMHAEHAGIGGTNGPTTGQRLQTRARSIQTSWRIADGARVHRGGFSFSRDRLDAAADSLAPLTVVTGQLAAGGDELAAHARRSTAWTLKHVVDGRAGKWKAGLEGSRASLDEVQTPNPHGRLQLSSLDAGTATWIVSDGIARAAASTTSAAAFIEQMNVIGPRATFRSGVRMDWQDGAGLIVSPRVLAAARLSGFQVSGGAGLFVQPWSPDIFAWAAARDGTTASTFVVHGVSPVSADGIDPAAGERLRALLAPSFERRRDLIVRAGVQRTFGVLQTGVEHTWTRAASLSGTVRARDSGGLVDIVSSDRDLRRHQTHVRASARRGANSVAAHYQHAWAFDDSDAALALPARQGDVRGEWARSSGVARHAAGLTAALRLPWQFRVSIAADARTGTPYTILTGRDADGLGAFTDRAGLSRNAGTLPAFRKVSLSGSRLVRVPRVKWLAFDVGVRADNLTNRRNITSVGPIPGSAMFGLPLGAAPGRSIRFWAALAR